MKTFIGTIKQMTVVFVTMILLGGCKNGEDHVIDNDSSLLKVGVFGGSISSRKESETAKDVWRANLKIKVTTCGIDGAGFSSETANNVPYQVMNAAAFDIYILWASTNDAAKSSFGQIDLRDDYTQDGGIIKVIELIRQKNSKALILFFTSMPRFDNEIYAEKIPCFVEDQIAICRKNNIPYLDQYRLCGFDKGNFMLYYLPDKIHLSNDGYASIALMQLDFLREQINIYMNRQKNNSKQ